jgi:hypothetical protein
LAGGGIEDNKSNFNFLNVAATSQLQLLSFILDLHCPAREPLIIMLKNDIWPMSVAQYRFF